MVLDVQMNCHQLEDRDEESLGLAEREVEERTQGERGLDRQVGVLRLTAATFGGLGVPVVDGVLRKPERDVAALDEGLVVLSPVRDAVAGLILRMDSGVHLGLFGLLCRKPDGGLQTFSRELPLCTNATEP